MSSLKERKSSKTRAADERAEAAVPRLPEVVIGRLLGFDAAGRPRVGYPGCPEAEGVAALAAAPLGAAAVGRELALLFADGDPARPFIVGLLHAPGEAAKPAAEAAAAEEAARAATVEMDGERLVLTAEREIVLKCGRASLTLTRAGKVLLRGAYLLSRSSGVNRIKGGSVQIN